MNPDIAHTFGFKFSCVGGLETGAAKSRLPTEGTKRGCVHAFGRQTQIQVSGEHEYESTRMPGCAPFHAHQGLLRFGPV